MLSFRDLLNSKEPFKGTQALKMSFDSARETITQSVKDAIKTFNTQKVTCMTTDWSKTGVV